MARVSILGLSFAARIAHVLAASVILVACGGGGGGEATQGAPPPTPLSLSYSSVPAYFVRQVTIAPLSPQIAGSPSSFSADPALPPGLSLDAATGVISGTPTSPASPTQYTITARDAAGQMAAATLNFAVQTGFTFRIAVNANSATSSTLSYQWQSSDGVVQNVNAPQTTWIAPSGPGLHFVYVLVSDGNLAYAEGRMVINTDTGGAPAFIPPNIPYSAPPQSAPTGVPLWDSITERRNVNATVVAGSAPILPPSFFNIAGATVVQNDTTTGVTLQSQTDDRGFWYFPEVTLTDTVQYQCKLPSDTLQSCGGAFVLSSQLPVVFGHVALHDGNLAGMRDPFFGIDVTGSAQILGCASPPCPAAPINDFGDFVLPLPTQAGLSLNIPNPKDTGPTLALPSDAGTLANGANAGFLMLPNSAPTISMSASLNGNAVGTFQQIFPIVSAALPSDNIQQLDGFLAYSGHDTRLGACRYYQAIGAVPASGCDNVSGTYSGAISFDDWKRAVKIDQYAPPEASTVTATFLNVVDLNLTREHHSIAYSSPAPGGVAAYVCNHLGPADANGNTITVSLPPTASEQLAVDTAISNAANGKNLVACVAMDYLTSPDVNGGKPFTRFLIFGPSGELLPSVNLDGRGEKFVPGACVVCHGAGRYQGHFPEDGSGFADVGGHFLPYDAGNFAFASTAPQRETDQETSIFQLNQNVLKTDPTPNTANLIAGWYANGQVLDKSYVPPKWQDYAAQNPSANAVSVYQNIIARSCRTCHAAIPGFDLDRSVVLAAASHTNVCGAEIPNIAVPNYTGNLAVDFSMPNSLVTFNRFWNSDQPAQYIQFVNQFFASQLTAPLPCQIRLQN